MHISTDMAKDLLLALGHLVSVVEQGLDDPDGQVASARIWEAVAKANDVLNGARRETGLLPHPEPDKPSLEQLREWLETERLPYPPGRTAAPETT